MRPDTPGVLQHNAGDIVKFLNRTLKIGRDQMLLVFTDGDLYPRDGWSYGKSENINYNT